MYVFVYGTLKSNRHNSDKMIGKLVGEGLTVNAYTLYDAGFYPVMTREKTTRVLGEVYKVDKKGLQVLDDFEGYPDLFFRELIPVSIKGTSLQAFAYFGTPDEYSKKLFDSY